jgi:hypothetical protein
VKDLFVCCSWTDTQQNKTVVFVLFLFELLIGFGLICHVQLTWAACEMDASLREIGQHDVHSIMFGGRETERERESS